MAMTATAAHPPATGANDAVHHAAIAVRGVVAVALGIAAIAFRGYSTLLVGAFVAFAFIDGIARLIIALRSTGRDRAWLLHALEGLAGIAVGIVALNVAKSLVSLTWTIAEWAFAVGALAIVFAVVAWRRLHDAFLWLLGGVVLIVLGIALLWFTLGGLLAPGIALGLFAFIYGAMSIAIALRSHRHHASGGTAIATGS